MQIFTSATQLSAHIKQLTEETTATIGFVPTMGALHDGHLSLLRQAQQRGNTTVCSIFVNPTQFNDPADLAKYPRPIAHDLDLLAAADCDIVFLPTVEEIYPDGTVWANPFVFGQLTTVMEGAHRPGHFDGMAQVVKRLLDIVTPHYIYMGQKDFQQQTVVKSMLQQMKSPCQLVCCPILREPDGLAMSSRNVRLNADERLLAPMIYKVLEIAKIQKNICSPVEVRQNALQNMSQIPHFSIDYLEIVDADTLLNIQDWTSHQNVLCTTVRLGQIRLLDNIIL